MRTALSEVKEALGADAVIMSNKKVTGGVEIVAAIDTETSPSDSRKEAVRSQVAKAMGDTQRRLADDKVDIRHSQQPARSAESSLSSKFSSLLDRYQGQSAQPPEEDPPADSLTSLLARQQKAAQKPAPAQNRQGALTRTRNHNHAFGGDYARQQQEKSQELDRLYQQKMQQKGRADGLPAMRREQELRHQDRNGGGRQPDRRQDRTMMDSRGGIQQGGEMEAMKKEMASIRNLLEHQLSGLMWQEVERKEPLRAMLIKRLEAMGLSPFLSDQLAGYIPEDTPAADAWSAVLELLTDQVITGEDNLLEHGGVIALLGPTGVGKTTTIAKLAARAAMDFGPEEIALVTTDTYRIGAHEQLSTYGRILGCPVKIAKDADELADILYQLRHRRLVFLDTAGMGQRDIRLTEQLDTLIQNSGSHIRSLLVLPATAQRRVLQETIDHFRRIPLSGCVLTKLDESLSLGELLSVTIENALPVTFLADGQRVPEDIRHASGQYLVTRASELLDSDNEQQHTFWSHDVPESNSADFYD